MIKQCTFSFWRHLGGRNHLALRGEQSAVVLPEGIRSLCLMQGIWPWTGHFGPCLLADAASADEAAIFIRRSKAEHYHPGMFGKCFRTNLEICPVDATVRLFNAFPLRCPEAEKSCSSGPSTADLSLDRSLWPSFKSPSAEAAALWAAFGGASLPKRWVR